MTIEGKDVSGHWLPVVGWEGQYEVSSEGSVRSLINDIILRPSTAGAGGYPRVVLSGKRCRSVHSLVTEAFLGARPDGQEVRHLNDVPTDVRLVNLAYGTSAENRADMVANGGGRASWTHCLHGHPFTPDNTGLRPHRDERVPSRYCLTCRRVTAAAWRAREKANA